MTSCSGSNTRRRRAYSSRTARPISELRTPSNFSSGTASTSRLSGSALGREHALRAEIDVDVVLSGWHGERIVGDGPPVLDEGPPNGVVVAVALRHGRAPNIPRAAAHANGVDEKRTRATRARLLMSTASARPGLSAPPAFDLVQSYSLTCFFPSGR